MSGHQNMSREQSTIANKINQTVESSTTRPKIITKWMTTSHTTISNHSSMSTTTTYTPTIFSSTLNTDSDYIYPNKTDGTVDPTIDPENCYSTVDDYELVPSVICSVLIIVGIFYLIYGYRCFKCVLFMTGLLFGTTIIYMICTAENLLPVYGNISVSVVAGLLFGLITLLVAYVGLFMLGFHLGLLSTCATLLSIYVLTPYIDSFSPPNSVWILFAIFMSSGLIGACATLYFQKVCTIFGTVIYGSTLTIICLDYFIENFKLIYWFRDKLRSGQQLSEPIGLSSTTSLCMISWILLIIWPISCLIGLFAQLLITSKGINYSNDYNYGVVTSTTSQSSVQTKADRLKREEQKLEQRQRKYRYLYQVRTAHGDVISQNYIQNLHKKKICPPDDSLTYNSDLSSHLTIIPSDSRTTTMSVA